MSCDPYKSLLNAYADESCSLQERTELEAHLETCPECAKAVLNHLKMKRLVRSGAMRFEASPSFRLKIESGLQQTPRRSWADQWRLTWKQRRLAWQQPRGTWPVFTAAALFVTLAITCSALWMRHAARAQAMAELLDMHIATVASINPVDVVSTDRHTVKPWFQGKLPFAFNLPELQNSPFKLLGGRLMYFEHSPGAQLLFETGKHRISVFVMQDRTGILSPNSGTALKRENGFGIQTWNSAGLRYVVVSDAGSADISALGELLRSAAGS
jgi:anti-sigma factor RsiW